MASYGVLGRVLAHSWSPQIHADLGDYAYQKYELEEDELRAFLIKGKWDGLNVTIPYKRNVLKWATCVSPNAKRLGAANTLIRKSDGTYEADNTDLFGYAYFLKRFCERHLEANITSATDSPLAGTKALVLGSGGASAAVCAALEDAGANAVVISRNGENNYDNMLELHSDASLIVNTTPVGMYPNCPATPVDEAVMAQMPSLKGVLDVVYNPERTGIMLAAEHLGIAAESGLVMLVAQAWQSSKIWGLTTKDASVIELIEAKILASTRNVVLIGMPGSGKTSAGRELAALTGRKQVDLDHAFAQEIGRSAAEVIEQEGEETFRALETQIVAKYCSQSGLVISCGGGVVTCPKNYNLMHQNGTIVMLNREISKLSTKGRPISAAKGVEKLAQERMPLYKAWADIELACTGSARGDALKIAQLLGL